MDSLCFSEDIRFINIEKEWFCKTGRDQTNIYFQSHVIQKISIALLEFINRVQKHPIRKKCEETSGHMHIHIYYELISKNLCSKTDIKGYKKAPRNSQVLDWVIKASNRGHM